MIYCPCMTKINNNRILGIMVFGIFGFLILALGAIAFMPRHASASTRVGTYEAYSNNFTNTFADPNNYNVNTPSYSPQSNTQNNGSVLGASTTKATNNSSSTNTSQSSVSYGDSAQTA